ncbi:MAG: methionine--tRNA ligase [Rhodobacteraceae bacterium]|nr:methionine--tRNA ligase [Paracoccaceae bacterium]
MARILITSAIPYINGIKHLGNLVGSQLPADLFARYLRLRGHEVMFICATDEHGTPAEIAAQRDGVGVREYCDRMYEIQHHLGTGFRLSFDHFGRSSSDRNRQLTQHFAGRLADNGHISEVREQQLFSVADNRFLPDRYVRGTCPNCGYEQARGDQCENCTKQLNPTELINPRSEISGSTELEMRWTTHLFLRQSKFRNRLEEWIDSCDGWPILTSSIARKWLRDGDGLQDRGITRDLDWGIPVRRGNKDWPGMEGKVFYVWFDAPIEYISATAEWADANELDEAAWQRWWRTDLGADDVRYVQFMGKDNVPFHTLSFPVTIMGSGEPWKLVDHIKSFNFLNYDGGQFSTSLRRGVFMDQALDILPPDYWRWWLLSHAPEHSDSEFTWNNFVASVNKDLADVLGNFVRRVTKFCSARFGNEVPQGGDWSSEQSQFAAELAENVRRYATHMEDIEIRKAAQQLRLIWASGNEYLQTAAPWTSVKEDPARAATDISICMNLIRLIAVISEPFIPDFSSAIIKSLRLRSPAWPDDPEAALSAMTPGHEFDVPDLLFRKISDEECNEWQMRFSGEAGSNPPPNNDV